MDHQFFAHFLLKSDHCAMIFPMPDAKENFETIWNVTWDKISPHENGNFGLGMT